MVATGQALDPMAHQGLVRYAVGLFSVPPALVGDAIQNAQVGLVAACRGWDSEHESGAKFSTYAMTAIRRKIQEIIRAERRWRRCRRRVRKADRQSSRSLVLFSELGGDFVRGRARVMARDVVGEAEDREDASVKAAHCLKGLKPRDRLIIQMRFGLSPYHTPHKLDEIGKALGVSKARVREIEARAFRDMRWVADWLAGAKRESSQGAKTGNIAGLGGRRGPQG